MTLRLRIESGDANHSNQNSEARWCGEHAGSLRKMLCLVLFCLLHRPCILLRSVRCERATGSLPSQPLSSAPQTDEEPADEEPSPQETLGCRDRALHPRRITRSSSSSEQGE